MALNEKKPNAWMLMRLLEAEKPQKYQKRLEVSGNVEHEHHHTLRADLDIEVEQIAKQLSAAAQHGAGGPGDAGLPRVLEARSTPTATKRQAS